jgi:cobalt-zinc-cadmium efflux system membrane fusion protein
LKELIMNNLMPICVAVFVLLCGPFASAGGGHGHGHDDHHEEAPKGKHGGRLLQSKDGFALEVTIYEPGIPPQARVYAYQGFLPVDPDNVELTLELHRFDRVDVVGFSKLGEFLLGDKTIVEPHSFDVKVLAKYKGKDYRWAYESHEGRVHISKQSAKISGIQVEVAEGRALVDRLSTLGQVGFNQDAVGHVAARYNGVVRSLTKRIGDYVRKGETLGVMLGTGSLNEFSIEAPASGRVVEKRVTVGEVVSAGNVMFVVADLSTVWVDFTVYRKDAARVAPRQLVPQARLVCAGRNRG